MGSDQTFLNGELVGESDKLRVFIVNVAHSDVHRGCAREPTFVFSFDQLKSNNFIRVKRIVHIRRITFGCETSFQNLIYIRMIRYIEGGLSSSPSPQLPHPTPKSHPGIGPYWDFLRE
jgi:hypothetical protein